MSLRATLETEEGARAARCPPIRETIRDERIVTGRPIVREIESPQLATSGGDALQEVPMKGGMIQGTNMPVAPVTTLKTTIADAITTATAATTETDPQPEGAASLLALKGRNESNLLGDIQGVVHLHESRCDREALYRPRKMLLPLRKSRRLDLQPRKKKSPTLEILVA
jgi:hypothetical protein